MPKITIPEKELTRTKSGIGLYKKLRAPSQKALSIVVIEQAFRDFCKSHKRWTQSMEDET